MKRRLLSFVLCLALILSLLPGAALATGTEVTSGSCGTNVTWNFEISTGTLTVSGQGKMTDYATEYGSNAPWKNFREYITSVVVSEGITHIGNGSFGGAMIANMYDNLETVDLPSTLKSIGTYAFAGAKITSISLPNGLEHIDNSAFSDTKLTSISIPASVNYMGDDGWFAFDCYSLSKIDVAAENQYFEAENNILYDKGKTKLIFYPYQHPATSYVIPSTICETIYIQDFALRDALQSITIPAGVTLSAREGAHPPDGFIEDTSQCITLYFQGTVPEITEDWWIYRSDGSRLKVEVYTAENVNQAQIISLFPANGATDVLYNTAGQEQIFQITFDREIAASVSDTWLADVDLTSDGVFSIYRASDDALVYSPSKYDTSDFGIAYTEKKATLSIHAGGLMPSETYYITMGEGFVRFADGSTNVAINKGDWVFRAKGFEKTGAFHFLGSDGSEREYTYTYSDTYFYNLSKYYNHELANMSLNLALAAFNSSNAAQSGYKETVAAANVRELLSDIGFSKDDIDTRNYAGEPTSSTVGVAFGKKLIHDGSNSYTLIAVAIRGGGYEAEWGGNFTVGNSGNHSGFQNASDKVFSYLKQYILNKKISGNVKLWITGYSRAAAIADLTAAKIIDELNAGGIGISSITLEKNNLYTYTFETPQATVNQNNTKYENIFNIVNPIDLVPKLAFDNWGFGRYGVTYSIPSAETSSNYSTFISRVSKEYTKIVTGTDTKILPIKMLSHQGETLDTLLNKYLSNSLSRKTYSDKYENIVKTSVAEVMKSTDTDYENIISAIEDFCDKHPVDALKIANMIKNTVDNKIFWVVFLEQGFEQLYSYIGLEGTTAADVIVTILSTVFQSHYPEVTLAWMRTINDADEYGSAMYRKLYINCPVDVSVYDSTNQLVAQIIQDEVQIIDGSTIGAYTDGAGQKIVILPTDESYHVSLIATDDGTVTYTATEYNIDTSSTEKVVSYYQIDVAAGDTLIGVIENLDDVDSAEYPLYSNDGTTGLTPSIFQSGKVEEFTVTVTTHGNGTASGNGCYINGEYSKVVAVPNNGETFLGWYIRGQLVSLDKEYRFLVDKTTEIVAKFTTNTLATNMGNTTSSTYNITVLETDNGTVTVTPGSAVQSTTVTLTATPNHGYQLSTLTVTDANGKTISVTDKGNGTYTFTMPASKVTVAASFTKGEDPVIHLPFTDVAAGDWFYDDVAYVYDKGMMNGTAPTLFAPNATTTRAMIVTILYRLEGEPAVSGSSVFTDVSDGTWYTDAIAWAAEKGVVNGTSATTFAPNDPITREQMAAILYRYAQYKGYDVTQKANLSGYTDAGQISAYATDAMAWANAEGLINGVTTTTLDPTGSATRAQVAAILHRFCEGVVS